MNNQKLTLTSRAFYNNLLGEYEKFATRYFDCDKLLPMNTGVDAVETAIKLCRRWAYEKNNIKDGEEKITVCANNFYGRTTAFIQNARMAKQNLFISSTSCNNY